MSLPAGLATALNAVTEILDQRLRQLAQDDASLEQKAHAEDLAVALEELNVVSEELDTQLRRLDEERERSAYFFDAAPYPYFITDLNGHLTEMNRAGAALLGVLPHRLAGKPLLAFIVDSQRGQVRDRVARVLAQKNDAWSECDAAITVRDGGEVPVRVHLRVMPYGTRGGSTFWILRPRDAG
jgi:PAS domain S-box-containing protein